MKQPQPEGMVHSATLAPADLATMSITSSPERKMTIMPKSVDPNEENVLANSEGLIDLKVSRMLDDSIAGKDDADKTLDGELPPVAEAADDAGSNDQPENKQEVSVGEGSSPNQEPGNADIASQIENVEGATPDDVATEKAGSPD